MSILVLQSSWWRRESWLLCLICLPGVLWWLCGSSSRCHGFVCSLWLWYFLIILTYYFLHCLIWSVWTLFLAQCSASTVLVIKKCSVVLSNFLFSRSFENGVPSNSIYKIWWEKKMFKMINCQSFKVNKWLLLKIRGLLYLLSLSVCWQQELFGSGAGSLTLTDIMWPGSGGVKKLHYVRLAEYCLY